MKQLLHFVTAIAILSILLACPAAARAAGTTITVKSAIDGTLVTLAGNSTCDLREAIQVVNNNGSSVGECPGGSAPYTIAFLISPSGANTITLASPLVLYQPVTIDGSTQPGWSSAPIIRVDGGNTVSTGFYFGSLSAGSLIKDLIITQFTQSQVNIAVGDSLNHVSLTGNYIGTDGSSALGSTYSFGVEINGGKYAQIGGPNLSDRNVISGNSDNVVIYGGGDFNTIEGNYIGLNAAGTALIGGSCGSCDGVLISNDASNNLIKGNVIAGNSSNGIDVASSTDHDNVIQGNYIGVNADGSAVLGPGTRGIELDSGSGTQIGGATPITGNLIAGYNIGIFVTSGSTGTKILGNRIGTDKTGTAAIPNSYSGIELAGPAEISGNVISGNTNNYGIYLYGSTTSGTTIIGNKIGVNALGSESVPLPNGNGVLLFNNASAQIAENWIANNTSGGVYIDNSSTVVGPSANNCFTSNDYYGVDNLNTTDAPFTGNWWGAVNGPGPIGSGSGDHVSTNVDFSSWLTTPPVACSLKLLSNSDFETDANHDNKPDKWTFTGIKTPSDKRDCTVHKTGKCSLKLAGNGKQKVASQTISKSGVAGDVFTFSLWNRTASIPAGSVNRLQVIFYNGGSVISTQTLNFTTGTHTFKTVGRTFTAPGPYTKIVFKTILRASSGNAWFDTAILNWAP